MARKPRKKIADPVEVDIIDELRLSQFLKEIEPYLKTFQMGDCYIMVAWSVEEGWHLSISTNYRYPSWDEIAHARYKLIPGDVHVGLPLPPNKMYISFHDNCFHLHESPVRGRPYKMSGPPKDYDKVIKQNTYTKDIINKSTHKHLKKE